MNVMFKHTIYNENEGNYTITKHMYIICKVGHHSRLKSQVNYN